MYISLVPRPLPDFISAALILSLILSLQPDFISAAVENFYLAADFSPQLRDKIWEWPGEKATCTFVCYIIKFLFTGC